MRLKNFNLQVGSQLFKSLGDESRVRILNLLHHNNEMCISDLEHLLDYTQTKTSRHISFLKNAGVLSSRKVDQWTFYTIKMEVRDLIEVVFSFMEKDSQLQKDLEDYKIMYSNRALSINKIEGRKYRRNEI